MQEWRQNKYLILNADDFGMCHSANMAIDDLMKRNQITAASLMVNTPWVLEAVQMIRKNPQYDVGIHLTHTSEWELYKWGPIRKNSLSLIDEYGYFPRKRGEVGEKANQEELYEESVSQIELAYKMGIDITNIDNHMMTLDFFPEILIELCARYRLPLRKARKGDPLTDWELHDRLLKLADEKGVFLLDDMQLLPFRVAKEDETYGNVKKELIRILKSMDNGITEVVAHPALDTEELRYITDTWKVRCFNYRVFQDEEIQNIIEEEQIHLIGWRMLREAQRNRS